MDSLPQWSLTVDLQLTSVAGKFPDAPPRPFRLGVYAATRRQVKGLRARSLQSAFWAFRDHPTGLRDGSVSLKKSTPAAISWSCAQEVKKAKADYEMKKWAADKLASEGAPQAGMVAQNAAAAEARRVLMSKDHQPGTA